MFSCGVNAKVIFFGVFGKVYISTTGVRGRFFFILCAVYHVSEGSVTVLRIGGKGRREENNFIPSTSYGACRNERSE